jgi:hypothetical protein
MPKLSDRRHDVRRRKRCRLGFGDPRIIGRPSARTFGLTPRRRLGWDVVGVESSAAGQWRRSICPRGAVDVLVVCGGLQGRAAGRPLGVVRALSLADAVVTEVGVPLG